MSVAATLPTTEVKFLARGALSITLALNPETSKKLPGLKQSKDPIEHLFQLIENTRVCHTGSHNDTLEMFERISNIGFRLLLAITTGEPRVDPEEADVKDFTKRVNLCLQYIESKKMTISIYDRHH